ncbi:MAG TPA: hypothetical protein VMR14_20870 [Streptosporangiaceae bacterium]|nr:hypothetical protein [Streptosporangiaceae bacterium]
MNQGGEQGHDDYGLPPVDIEIPDDARELYRDVQAYHRELRALRRHQRSVRWRAPFHRTGVAIPLLAGCLIVALLAVMLSAMLTANPYMTGQRPAGQPDAGSKSSPATTTPAKKSASSAGASSAGASSASASSTSPTTPALTTPGGTGAASRPTAGRLPGKTISVAGKPLDLVDLRSTALAIVPTRCDCDSAVKQLLLQAQTAGVIVYLVGPPGTSVSMLNRLANLVSGMKALKVATDDHDALTAAYQPMGLTVLLVDARGSVTEHTQFSQGVDLEKQLQLLKPAS